MAIDINLQLRAASVGALTVTESGVASLDMGPDLVPQTYMLFVPEAAAPADTLQVTINESAAAAPPGTPILSFPPITGAMTFPLQIFITGKCSLRYRNFTATSAGVAPDWGDVIIAPVPAGRYENH